MPVSTPPEHTPRESFIHRASNKQEVWFNEGCYITEWLNDPADPAVSIARARVLPGTSTRWHHLPALRERYVVLEGEGEIEVAGLPPSTISAGDCVSIAQGAAQRIHNRGHVDLIFLAICTPRFEPQSYVDGR
ncbi:MAG: cupin domain-containing protein [Burkholderiaceae bacterium]